jgi:hypothetical protein
MVCAERAIGTEIVLGAPINLLGDVGQWEDHLGMVGDSVNLFTRKVHDLRRMYHWIRNHFGHTRWYSSVTWVKWKLVWRLLISA